MVRTLRITSVLTVLLAAVVVALPFVVKPADDEGARRLLDAPGVVELFQQSQGTRDTTSADQISPLVRQAQGFADYLNPRTAPSPSVANQPPRRPVPTVAPPVSTPKFEVVGTSVHPTKPEESLALIDEPGKGLRWVRNHSEFGHQTIEDIRDGVVVVRDGSRTYEKTVPERTGVSLLDTGGAAASAAPQPAIAPAAVPQGPAARPTFGRARPAAVPAMQPEPVIDEQEKAALGDLVERLKELQRAAKSEKTDGAEGEQDREAMMQQLISDFKAARVGSEEAQTLEDLGKDLQAEQRGADGNTPSSGRPRRKMLPPRPGLRPDR